MAGGKRKREITYGRHRPHVRFNSLPDDSMSWFPSTDKIDHSQNPPPLPANKPTSQKAATMPADPSDDDIQSVQEFTGMPRSDAIRYLKVSCALAMFECTLPPAKHFEASTATQLGYATLGFICNLERIYILSKEA